LVEHPAFNRVVAGSNPVELNRTFIKGSSKGPSSPSWGLMTRDRKKESVFEALNPRPKGGRIHSRGLDKSFSETELKKFFSVVDKRKDLVAFLTQLGLGLRVGELVRLRLDDINFQREEVRVRNIKTKEIDFLLLPNFAGVELQAWTEDYQEDILAHDGYVFFSSNRATKRKHISEGYLRKAFRRYIKIAGLDDYYVVIPVVGKQAGEERRLFRLTTHSLRHSMITRVYKQTKDMVLAQRIGRHSTFNTTETYINLHKSEARSAVNGVFGSSSEIESCDDQEFMKFYRMWKKMKD